MKEGWVYFLRCGTLMKIGFSIDPLKRIWQIIRSGHREITAVPGVDLTDIECLGILPGAPELEEALHIKFADLKWAGEWFICDTRRVAALSPEPLRIPLERNVRTDMDKIGIPWGRLNDKLSVPCVLNMADQMRPPHGGVWLRCETHDWHFVRSVASRTEFVPKKAEWTVTYA
jgi:T5orf172 domain